jgi:hypothetical protein
MIWLVNIRRSTTLRITADTAGCSSAVATYSIHIITYSCIHLLLVARDLTDPERVVVKKYFLGSTYVATYVCTYCA